MGSRQGSLLEKNVERIFKLSGFKTQRNIFIKDYEIDVLAKYGNLTIIVQCKQYEKSPLNIKDILHLWASKNKEIKADMVVIAIFGQDAKREEKALANKLRLVLWDGGDIDKLDDLVAKKGVKAREKILEELGLNYEILPKSLKEEFIRPFLSIEEISKYIKEKTKVKTIKSKIVYNPLISLRVLLESVKEGFNIKKEDIYYFNLEGKEPIKIEDPNINKEIFLEVKPVKGDFNKPKIRLADVENIAIKELIKKSKSKYYYSRLPIKKGYEAVFSQDKDKVFEEVKYAFSEEIDSEIEKIKDRYEPRIEDIENNISELSIEISHLSDERKSCRGLWGSYKGDTHSEQRRNKARFESLGRKIEWKEMKISQFESKKDIIKKRMKEEINSLKNRYDSLIETSISEFDFEPEENECEIREKKLIWIPRLSGEISTESGIKIPIEITYNKILMVGQCSKCEKPIKEIANLGLCSLCGEIFCPEHYMKCEKCKKDICKEDSWICNGCGKQQCKKEKKILCKICNKYFCNDCIINCSICGKDICKSDTLICNNCKKQICPKDYKKCYICKKTNCLNCFSICGGCKKEACKKDFDTCPHCKKRVCQNCIRMKRKFLILKEKRCVFCIDKK